MSGLGGAARVVAAQAWQGYVWIARCGEAGVDRPGVTGIRRSWRAGHGDVGHGAGGRHGRARLGMASQGRLGAEQRRDAGLGSAGKEMT